MRESDESRRDRAIPQRGCLLNDAPNAETVFIEERPSAFADPTGEERQQRDGKHARAGDDEPEKPTHWALRLSRRVAQLLCRKPRFVAVAADGNVFGDRFPLVHVTVSVEVRGHGPVRDALMPVRRLHRVPFGGQHGVHTSSE